MHFSDAITEYCFDCKVRKLSPKSISNYQKQLKYLQRYGYINISGETIIPFEFEIAGPFYDGIALAKKGGKVSDTGAIEIEATAKLRHALKIFDGLAAVVDGTVIAEIYDNNVRVGEAKLVLPALGLKHSTEKIIKGICLSGGKKEKANKYRVSFKPYHLWEMEA